MRFFGLIGLRRQPPKYFEYIAFSKHEGDIFIHYPGPNEGKERTVKVPMSTAREIHSELTKFLETKESN